MAVDKKITELVALSGASVIGASDLLAIVDLANDETKKITIDALRIALGLDTMTMASGKGLDFSADTKGIFKGLESATWWLNAQITNTDSPLGSSGGEWELQVSNANSAVLGSNIVTEANGIFTFITTGSYFITYTGLFYDSATNGLNSRLSLFSDIGAGPVQIADIRSGVYAATAYSCGGNFAIIKVENVAHTVNLSFNAAHATSRMMGGASGNGPNITFIKFADI